tara:strand:- start:1877 stop:2053 length:177 start_codon:yes stop_codon:yes gene_type:complete
MTSKNVETDEQYNIRVLDTIIGFLKENEQYGDDWSSEIKVLKSLQLTCKVNDHWFGDA